jgi:hypothetical protein
MQKRERIAAGGLVSLVGGFFIAVSLGTSREMEMLPQIPALIWLVTILRQGV